MGDRDEGLEDGGDGGKMERRRKEKRGGKNKYHVPGEVP